jgi:abequosyltransferase
MNSLPFLSVCIPTFNRAVFLRECLESIDSRGAEGLFEIVVSDNASFDETVSVLEEFSSLLPLRWTVQSENIGMERNFDAVVALARGTYCWLLGSDDALEPSALSRLVSALQATATDIYHFGYVQADISLERLYAVHTALGRVGPDDHAEYFAKMPNMSMLLTFISTFAFRRSLWMDRRERIPKWIGSVYVHTFVMHAALAEGASLSATDECLVLARGNNPNDYNSVPGKLMAIDSRVLNRLVDEIYGGNLHFRAAFARPFRKSYPPRAMIYMAANGGFANISEARLSLLGLGFSRFLLDALLALERLNLLKVVKIALDFRRWVLHRISPKL